MPPGSHPACRLPPQRTDANLVISFSDEETSDDCGHPSQAKTLEIKGITSRLIGNRKPPFPPIQSNLKPNHNAKHKAKSFPKKPSLSRTFVLSNLKVSRTNSTSGQGTQIKHRNMNKKCSGLDHASRQPMNLSSSELQDLRHKIALRENELKLKAGKQNKIVSSSVSMLKNSGTNCSDSDAKEIEETITDSMILNDDAMGNSGKISLDIDSLDTLNKNEEIASVPFIPNDDSKKNPRINSSDIEELETYGHGKKRMKVNDPFENLHADDNQAIPTSKPITANKEIIKNSNQGINMVCDSFCNKESSLEQSGFNTKKWKEFPVISRGTLPSADITFKGVQSENYPKHPDLFSEIQSVKPRNVASCPLSFNPDTMGSIHRSNFIQRSPPELMKKAMHGKYTLAANKLNFQLSTTPTWNILNEGNNSGKSDGHLQSLIEMEEINDRELEEALEIRRNCEIEEMNTLRIYRKAHRDLIEANGRCSLLYKKRDVHSAHLRSVMMGDSTLLQSLSHYPPVNGLRCGQETDIRTAPITTHLVQKELNIYNPPNSDSCVPVVEDDATAVTTNKVDEINLVAEQHTAVSQPVFEQTTTRNISLCNVQKISADGDQEGISFAHKYAPDRMEILDNGEKDVGDNRFIHTWLEKGSSLDNNLKENLNKDVSLRSELFPRPTKQSVKCKNHVLLDDHEGRNTCNVNNQSENLQLAVGGSSHDAYDREKFDHLVEIEPYHGGTDVSTSRFIFRSALYHMRSKSSFCLYGKGQKNHVDGEKNSHDPKFLKLDGKDAYINDDSGKFVSEESNLRIHTFWPLCMFELRGKCNDDKCPWQHTSDYSKSSGHASSPHVVGNFPPKYFRALQTLSNSQQHGFMVDGSVVNGSDCGDDDIQGSLNRHSLYFLSRKDGLDQFRQGLVGNEHILEMAFFALNNSDPYKSYGVNKVLNILSRALEANPTSVILWVVYLRIFYRGKRSVVGDDMFLHAVKHNEGSYELWLMYINSRVVLQDRISAYNSALSSLSKPGSLRPASSDPTHLSSCILDIFLQMLDLYRMSARTDHAVRILHSSFLSPDPPSSLHLPSLLPSLTLSDRCIFWSASLYFLLYRNLPLEILTRFERSKSPSPFHWPPPPPALSAEEKQQALSLMELAAASLIHTPNADERADLRSLHLFAINRVLFTTALDPASGSSLLDRYLETYPSCLELALLSARRREDPPADPPFLGFRRVLEKWQSGDGVHCLFNQYAEHALCNGRPDIAGDILSRWFASATGEEATADSIFRPLNLSLYKLLQGDESGARGAAARALEKAGAGDEYSHALREHAVLSHPGTGPGLASGPGSIGALIVGRASGPLLSRRFTEGVKRPRIRQLIERLLGPATAGFYEANVVLETWFGPGLLPEAEQVEVLVDFVESVMAIVPANYELGIAACRVMKGRGLFWAVSLLLDSLYLCFPKAPERAWVEAARFLEAVAAEGRHRVICEGFREKAVCEYPFSVELSSYCLALGRPGGEGRREDVVSVSAI